METFPDLDIPAINNLILAPLGVAKEKNKTQVNHFIPIL